MYKPVFQAILLLGVAACLPVLGQAPAPAKELMEYIQAARRAGLKDDKIQQNAEKAGWPELVVKDALAAPAGSGEPAVSGSAGTVPANVVETGGAAKTAPQEDHGVTSAAASADPAPAASAPQPGPIDATAGTTAAASPGAAGGTKPATIDRGVPAEYQIGGGDVISINVWGEPSASAPSVVVRPDGKISMPLVKEVFVAGLTPTQLEKVITDQLSDKIKAPDVTVVVNQVNSKKIFLLGAGIKKEGPISFSYGMTVMQALSEAGGLTDYAKKKKIYVLRNESGRQFKLPFDYDSVLQGEHMELNYSLIPGDIVVVPNH